MRSSVFTVLLIMLWYRSTKWLAGLNLNIPFNRTERFKLTGFGALCTALRGLWNISRLIYRSYSKLKSVSTSNILKEAQQQAESVVLKQESRRALHMIASASSPQRFSQNASCNLTYVVVCYTARQCHSNIIWFWSGCCTLLIDGNTLRCCNNSYDVQLYCLHSVIGTNWFARNGETRQKWIRKGSDNGV
jgi:hypothetical protein